MGEHLIDGEFQSDKYPTTPRGKVPLSTKDPTAQDLLWQYAQRRREVDAEFSDDLETALRNAGFEPPALNDAAAFLAAQREHQATHPLDKTRPSHCAACVRQAFLLIVGNLQERLADAERHAEAIGRNRDYAYGRLNEIGRVLDPTVADGVNLSPDAVLRWAKELAEKLRTPIPMLLLCPRCRLQHVDQPQPEKNWDNPPHRSHECQGCGCVWRPADVATTGVEAIATRGSRDDWPSPIDELSRLLDGVPVRIGLHQQGHLPTIERMLAAGESWDAIGKAIGWCPTTAEKHYAWHLDYMARGFVYLGRASCGCVLASVVDSSEEQHGTADDVAEMIRHGLTIERVHADDERNRTDRCEHGEGNRDGQLS